MKLLAVGRKKYLLFNYVFPVESIDGPREVYLFAVGSGENL